MVHDLKTYAWMHNEEKQDSCVSSGSYFHALVALRVIAKEFQAKSAIPPERNEQSFVDSLF